MAKNYNSSKSNTAAIAAEDEADVTGEKGINEAFTEDVLLPNLDDILNTDDASDPAFDSKAIQESRDPNSGSIQESQDINAPLTEGAPTPSMTDLSLADPEGDFTQGEDWFAEPEFGLNRNHNSIKSNTANIAAEDEEGAEDPGSPGGVTDWSTLEPSGFPQTFEDPTLTDPNLMEDPGTTGQDFDYPMDA